MPTNFEKRMRPSTSPTQTDEKQTKLTFVCVGVLELLLVASIPTYFMSIMKFPEWAIDTISSQMSHFFWGNLVEVHKYHLANWGLVSRKKELGGFGIPNLREFNMAVLASWSKRIYDGRE